MRFLFKTSYGQDAGLFRDGVQRSSYMALLVAVLALPLAVPEYVGDISLVFIYSLCGVSLMVLTGYTGLVSLGHAAFVGIGAYAYVYVVQDLGGPWIVGVAAAVLGGFGSIVGALIGGLTIGLIEMFAGTYLPQGFKDVAAYVVLLVVMAVRPQGMFGTVGRKKV